MDMTEKNGQPSMEEILASIRRIIAEEPADAISLDFKPRSGLEPGNGAQQLGVEDAADFELPSMFRASSTTGTSDKTNGPAAKLLDALRATPQLDDEARSRAHPEFPLPNASIHGANGASFHERSETGAAHQSLSALRPFARADSPPIEQNPAVTPVFVMPAIDVVPAETAGASAWPASDAIPEVNTKNVAREMVPFKDQHFSRMFSGGSSPAAAPAPAPSAPQTVSQASPSFATLAVSSTVPPPLTGLMLNGASLNGHNAGYAPVAPGVAPQSLTAALRAAEGQNQQASAHGLSAPDAGGAGIEDATAELLRPMLRQWLSDNMPRMVEKALHIEVAESVKPGKKP